MAAPAARPAQGVHPGSDEAVGTPLPRRDRLRGATLAGLGVLPVAAALGFECIAQSPQAMAHLPPSLAPLALAPRRASLGSTKVLLAVATAPLQILASRGQKMHLLAHLSDKLADFVVGAYAVGVDGASWQSQKEILWRAPKAAYPDSCDWTRLNALCPDPLSYTRSAAVAPYIGCLLITGVGVMAGACLGFVFWRQISDGTQALNNSAPFRRYAPWYLQLPVELVANRPSD